MTKNEGTLDRIIRLVAAVVLLGAAVAVGVPTVAGIVLVVLAVVLGVTAAVGVCPLYKVFGLSTCPLPAQR